MKPNSLSMQQIGRLGELLVQYELLRYGVESSAMTTDAGVDLVAFSSLRGKAFTIQVKTNLMPKAAGGKGSPAIDWWISRDCPAQWYACVDLHTRRIWLLKSQELFKVAQQQLEDRVHFYMYTEPGTRAYLSNGDNRFSKFLFESRISNLLAFTAKD